MEIERQFLVDRLPQLPEECELLRQGYVALLPEIRIRQIGESHFRLTVKRGAGLVREEWETEISRQEFDNLADRLCPGTCMIEKRRYKIPLAGGLVAELHVHAGHLTGFNYVEVEFSDVEAAKAFVPPVWFGREVTEDARFSYGTLAQAKGMEIVREILRCEG
jgi:CYTH domain-containing protein